jgi:hypothetical protein
VKINIRKSYQQKMNLQCSLFFGSTRKVRTILMQ